MTAALAERNDELRELRAGNDQLSEANIAIIEARRLLAIELEEARNRIAKITAVLQEVPSSGSSGLRCRTTSGATQAVISWASTSSKAVGEKRTREKEEGTSPSTRAAKKAKADRHHAD